MLKGQCTYFKNPVHCYARLAQSVERGTFNPEVKGSSPLSGENFFFIIFPLKYCLET